MTPRKLYNFHIDPDLAEGLKKLKERNRESEAAIVRRALRQYLDREGVLTERKRTSRKRSSPKG